MLERGILAAHGFKRTALATRATLAYLESGSPALNRLFRAAVLGAGQRRPAPRGARAAPLRRAGAPARLAAVGSPLPPPGPGRAARRAARLRAGPGAGVRAGRRGAGHRLLLPRAAARSGSTARSGSRRCTCCSARGTRVVLPPPYLCCGFPAHANARTEMHGRIVLRDTIVFARSARCSATWSFDALRRDLRHLPRGARRAGGRQDLRVRGRGRRALRAGARRAAGDRGRLPLPRPLPRLARRRGAAVLAGAGARVATVPHCCSEAGTLALSRPDITDAMLHRKRAALAGGARRAAGRACCSPTAPRA